MKLELSLFSGELVKQQTVNEILKCNALTMKFGLALTEGQALALVETRYIALKENGRIEVGSDVIDKIIKEFCDSRYISVYNYEEILHELLKTFYYYKNETLDMISDDDLIRYMKKKFDGVCNGSIELLSDRELYKLAQKLRYGNSKNYLDDDTELSEE